MFSQLTKPRARPVTNVVAVFVVALTTIPILLANRLTERTIE
jgi:putative spermidine/putrescine transport system permease protein